MAEVTGYTSDFIEGNMIVDAEVRGDDLILKTPSEKEINAGNVRGAQGYGSAEIHGLSEIGSTPAIDDELVLYDTSATANKKSYFWRLYDFITSSLGNQDNKDKVVKVSGTLSPTNPNKIAMTYADGLISTVNVRNNADSANIMAATMSYTDDTLNTITVVAGGTTVVYTLNYADGNISSITKAVS